MIIPINSPCYCASYNGAIEHCLSELKSWIGRWKTAAKISVKCAKSQIDPAAWRISARKWMEKHRLIIIHKPVLETARHLW